MLAGSSANQTTFLYLSLLAVAEETLAEFLGKATGTAVDWVQMIGMKVFNFNVYMKLQFFS